MFSAPLFPTPSPQEGRFITLKLRKASGQGKDGQEEPKGSQAICLEYRKFEQGLNSCRALLRGPALPSNKPNSLRRLYFPFFFETMIVL